MSARAASVATAFAPAGVGNVGVGFDILGHTLPAVGDRVTVRRTERRGVTIAGIEGIADPIPTDPERNTATAGLLVMVQELNLPFGLEVRIRKGIPLGSGMGGSAASAVGALVAANAVLPEPLDRAALFGYALIGEAAASGAVHGDNLAPGLFGGLTLVRSTEPADVIRIPVPPSLRCVLVHPHHQVETRLAREALGDSVPLPLFVQQSANLAGVLAGCYTGDLALIGRSLSDVVIEPAREHLVPGFRAVKDAALAAGALGASISGAGPSLFAWCDGDEVGEGVRRAMIRAFAAVGLESEGWVSPVDGPGAYIVEAE